MDSTIGHRTGYKLGSDDEEAELISKACIDSSQAFNTWSYYLRRLLEDEFVVQAWNVRPGLEDIYIIATPLYTLVKRRETTPGVGVRP